MAISDIPRSRTYRDAKPPQILHSFPEWLLRVQLEIPAWLRARREYRHSDVETLHISNFWLTEEAMQNAIVEAQMRSRCHPEAASAALLQSIQTQLAKGLVSHKLAFTHFGWVSDTIGLLQMNSPVGLQISPHVRDNTTLGTRCYRLEYAIGHLVQQGTLKLKR